MTFWCIGNMLRLAVFTLFAASCAASPLNTMGAPSLWAPRVINGDIADEGAWPSQLSLERLRPEGWGHTCGATLLDERRALSAAHCTEVTGPTERRIVAGINNRDDPNGIILELIQITNHPDYINSGALGWPNDVSVVIFDRAIEFTDRIQPGLLPDEGEDFIGQECFITGWGRIDISNNIPNELREGAIDVISNSQCLSEMGGTPIDDYHICVKDPNEFYGACNGDSGGPINCRESPSDPFKQVGVASFVRASGGNCLVQFPSVYGRVSYHLQWIDTIRI